MKFPYDIIDHIVVENKNKYSLMIILSTNQNNDKLINNIPYLNLTIPERNYFIENLICYYTVFYITEKKKMKDLVIKKRDKIIFQMQVKNQQEYLKLFNIPPSKYKALSYINYV